MSIYTDNCDNSVQIFLLISFCFFSLNFLFFFWTLLFLISSTIDKKLRARLILRNI